MTNRKISELKGRLDLAELTTGRRAELTSGDGMTVHENDGKPMAVKDVMAALAKIGNPDLSVFIEGEGDGIVAIYEHKEPTSKLTQPEEHCVVIETFWVPADTSTSCPDEEWDDD